MSRLLEAEFFVFALNIERGKNIDFAVLQNACKRSTYFAGNLCLPYLSCGIFFFQFVLIKLSFTCSVFIQWYAQA